MIERPTRFITRRPRASRIPAYGACASRVAANEAHALSVPALELGVPACALGIRAHAPGVAAYEAHASSIRVTGCPARAPVGAAKVKLREATPDGAGQFFPA